MLLARGGRPTGADELIELIWGEDAPASALNVIHKYVGSLRRILEPELLPRGTGSFLLRRSSGYLCTAGSDILDLAKFRQSTVIARAELAAGDHAAALDSYLAAVSLWSGPAGDGWAHAPGAAPIFAALNDEYFQACIEAAGVAQSLGKPEQVLPALHLAAAMAPLHEPVQASLVTVLGRAGHQAEALAVFDVVRRRLADDLGIDPGATLQAAHQGVLAQTWSTRTAPAGPPAHPPADAVARRPADSAASSGEDVATHSSSTAPRVATAPSATDRLVGRADEMAALGRAVEPALLGGTAVVLVEGEPGAGKSRLLAESAHHAAARGALVVWGHCLEGEGTPTMWPWVEVVTSLLDALPSSRRETWLARDIGRFVGVHRDEASAAPDGNARFRLLEQLVELMAESATERPVVLMIDDLQWAEATALQLLDAVIARLPDRTAIVGALRNRGPTPGVELVRTLATASRATGHRRVLVSPLNTTEVAELVHVQSGVVPTADAVKLIHERTAGNPFFVQELGRLLADSLGSTESVLAAGVPGTVRDVVRDRLAVLDDHTRSLLEVAALIGRDVELILLAEAASSDVAPCLERLEPVRALGFIGPVPEDPFSYRYTHDLVRQAVSESVSPGRAAAIHGRIADAIDVVGIRDESASERLAHHLWTAGPVTDPARTVAALVAAGERATAKTSLEAAERHFGSAVELARRSSLIEPELAAISQLIAVVGMRSMYGIASVSLLERAEELARRLGREREAAGFLFSRWTAHGQALELDRSTPLVNDLDRLASTSDDPVVRTYGRTAAGIHQWCVGNIGESFRRLDAISSDLLPETSAHEGDPVHDGVQLMAAGMFAEIAGYHGETARARAVFARLTTAAGEDPYAVTVATSFEARTAAVVGDALTALHAAERGIAADPEFSFTSLGTYLRLARCWALAMTGQDPEAAADEAEQLIRANLTSPVRTCVSTWFALLGEMRLAAGSLEAAAGAIEQAEECLERHGQRSSEGLVILLRAQLTSAAGDGRAAIREAERARALSTEREAHLFARRAERFLAELQR
ncbi:ATP-binding protein [Agromyces sp. NPDC055520]